MKKILESQNSIQQIQANTGNIKISVVVPVYNSEQYISKCLLALTKQTLKEIEIIVINDGSTDNSLDIIKIFANSDSRIKIINQENKKQGRARNEGFKIAKGEYTGYVDSDDWVDFDYFEKLYNCAKKFNADIALATNIRTGNGKTKKRLDIKDECFATSLQNKFNLTKQYKNPCPTNKIYKTDFLKKYNILFEENMYCEDKLFTTKAVFYANGIVSVPDINYYYYRNPNSTVKVKDRKHKQQLKKDKETAKLSVLNFLKEKNAKLKDKEFWATTKRISFFNIPILSIKESLKTKRYYIFSCVRIFERKINEH